MPFVKCCLSLFLAICCVGAARAADYQAGTGNADLDAWLAALNDKALANPAGPAAEIAGASGATVPVVDGLLKKGYDPADAYMILRMAKICACGNRRVVTEFEGNRNHGWGTIAQDLEVSPKSLEFAQLRVRVDTLRSEDVGPANTAGPASDERAVDKAARESAAKRRKEKDSDH